MILRHLIAKLGFQFDDAAFKKGESAITKVKKVATGLAAVFVASKAAGALRDIVMGSSEAADKVGDTAAAIGVTTQALQELGHAAALSGSSQEELTLGLAHLSRSAFSAKNGSKEASEAYRKLGVRLADGNGRLRSADALLMDVADGMAQLKSPSERTALAMQVFGRSGARLVPMLAEGSAGVAKMRAEVAALGGAFSPEFIAQSDKFQDNMGRARLALQGIKNAIAAALLPRLNDLVERFIRWRVATKAIVDQKIARWTEALAKVLEKLADVGIAAARVAGWIGDALGRLGPELAIVVGLFAALALAIGLPGILITLLAAAFVVLLEDIKVFSEGGTSLIGHLINKYKAWVEEFTNPPENDPNEHWLMRFLRGVVAMADRARKELLTLYEWATGSRSRIIGGNGRFINAGEEEASPGDRADMNVYDENGRIVSRDTARGPSFDGAETTSLIESFLRGAVGSALGEAVHAMPSPASGGATVNMQIEVNGAPGQDEGAVAGEVVRQIEDWATSQFNDAKAALTPSAAR